MVCIYCDGPNLSRAMLFCDSHHGIYIPQLFAKQVNREYVTGVSNEDYEILEAGPDHEHYWDAWADVLDNSKIHDPVVGECYLYQDEDLWVVPVERDTSCQKDTEIVVQASNECSNG